MVRVLMTCDGVIIKQAVTKVSYARKVMGQTVTVIII